MGNKKNSGKTLYLECLSGISGDMTVAALLDLGADEKVLQKALTSLPVHGFETKVSRVKKAGLDVCDFAVILDEAHENHDHDMEYLHGEAHEHAHSHEHMHGHSHEHHDHGHGHEHHHDHADEHHHEHVHHHEHRGLPEIFHIIDHADMTAEAKEIAKRIFQILAKAEAKAHGVPETEVHFHEVGAVDSIVDIIAAAVCFDNLGIKECIIPVLYEGCGTVRCQHGILPIPVPATSNIVCDNGLKLCITDVKGELVTPTGAAMAAAFRTSDKLPAGFSILKIGMGGGKRTYERPSILRAMLIEMEEANRNEDSVWKLETNLDDCTGETLGYTMGRLLEAGAKDVNYMPIFMKKNRPAYQLNVLCSEEKREELEQIIFRETTTIGIRRQKMQRTVLERSCKSVQTIYGEVQVKECNLGGQVRYYPEYDSVASVCRENNLPFQEVYNRIVRECNE